MAVAAAAFNGTSAPKASKHHLTISSFIGEEEAAKAQGETPGLN